MNCISFVNDVINGQESNSSEYGHTFMVKRLSDQCIPGFLCGDLSGCFCGSLCCPKLTTVISKQAKDSDEPIFIANKEDWKKLFRHRDMIYAAEMSRLNGGPLCTQEKLDTRMEALFDAFQK